MTPKEKEIAALESLLRQMQQNIQNDFPIEHETGLEKTEDRAAHIEALRGEIRDRQKEVEIIEAAWRKRFACASASYMQHTEEIIDALIKAEQFDILDRKFDRDTVIKRKLKTMPASLTPKEIEAIEDAFRR